MTNVDDLPGKPVLHRILQIAKDIDKSGYSGLLKQLENVKVIGRLFHGSTQFERQICDMTAARLGQTVVDLGWTDADSMSTEELLDSVKLASETSDLLLTAFASSETFGEGRMLTGQFAGVSTVPFASLHDDVYAWQTALAGLFGMDAWLNGLAGKRIAIAWGFGNSFTSPAAANSMLIGALAFGAHVRVVAPTKFSFLNRVRRIAEDTSQCSNVLYEEIDVFEESFNDVDAVFALNWMRLDDFNHPERNLDHAKEFKNWHFDDLPKQTVFSSLPGTESSLLASRKILDSERNITHHWLKNRVTILAATFAYLIENSTPGKPANVI